MKKRNLLNFDSSETMPQVLRGYMSFRPCDLPMLRRGGRRSEAIKFRHEYFYGSSMDRKTCIWSCDGDSWLDKSSGIMWVGVRGMDSICVDIKRVRLHLKNHTKESFLHHFRKTIIFEIEDLEDPSSKFRRDFQDPPNKLRQRVDQCIKKPFGIVSVCDEVDKESGHKVSNEEYEKNKQADRVLEAREQHMQDHFRELDQKTMLPASAQRDEKNTIKCLHEKMETDATFKINETVQLFQKTLPAPAQRDEKNTIKYLQEKMETDTTFTINETVQALEHDEKKAIKFLREKMESDVVFTMDETIQAAISAFQHLFRKKFNANEIGVTVLDLDYDDAKELEIHDIEKHLAVINEPGSGGSSGSGNSLEEDENDIVPCLLI